MKAIIIIRVPSPDDRRTWARWRLRSSTGSWSVSSQLHLLGHSHATCCAWRIARTVRGLPRSYFFTFIRHIAYWTSSSPLTIQHSDESVTTVTGYNTMWFVVQCVGGDNLFKWGGDSWSITGTCDLWKWKVSASKEEEATYWKWSVGGLVLKAVYIYTSFW